MELQWQEVECYDEEVGSVVSHLVVCDGDDGGVDGWKMWFAEVEK